MIACAFVAAPKLRPPAGTPPIAPASTVSVIRSRMPSSWATVAMPSGMPDPEVDDRVELQQHRRAARDHLARVQRGRGRPLRRDAHLAGVGRVVALGERLHVRGAAAGDDHAVDEDARDADLARAPARDGS